MHPLNSIKKYIFVLNDTIGEAYVKLQSDVTDLDELKLVYGGLGPIL